MSDNPFLGDIFEEPPPVVRRKQKPPVHGVRWSRYRSTTGIHCDECVRYMHDHWSEGGHHAPNPAIARRVGVDGVATLLCWYHASEQRTKDGLNPLRRRTSG